MLKGKRARNRIDVERDRTIAAARDLGAPSRLAGSYHISSSPTPAPHAESVDADGVTHLIFILGVSTFESGDYIPPPTVLPRRTVYQKALR